MLFDSAVYLVFLVLVALIIWGALHGVIVHIVCLAFVFLRAASVQQAAAFLGQLTRWSWQPGYAPALGYLAIFTLPLFAIDLRLEQTGHPQPNIFIYFRF